MACDWADRIGSRVLPTLCKIAEEIAHEYPQVGVHVRSHPVGSATDFQAHDFSVECVFDAQPPDESDCVALSITIAYLTTRPKLYTLDVCWGHPSGFLEIDLLSDPVDLDDDAIRRIEAALPQLEVALKAAVARGRPPMSSN